MATGVIDVAAAALAVHVLDTHREEPVARRLRQADQDLLPAQRVRRSTAGEAREHVVSVEVVAGLEAVQRVGPVGVSERTRLSTYEWRGCADPGAEDGLSRERVCDRPRDCTLQG